jgi:hypothetical protein
MVLGFTQHGNVPCMEHIKGGESDANFLSVLFELFNMVEYHSWYAGLGTSSSKT